MMAIEEIAESIDALQDNNINVKDPASEDYIPPNRKLMLKCTHRPRWEMAEDDELLSFQQCEVMAKYPTLPMGLRPYLLNGFTPLNVTLKVKLYDTKQDLWHKASFKSLELIILMPTV